MKFDKIPDVEEAGVTLTVSTTDGGEQSFDMSITQANEIIEDMQNGDFIFIYDDGTKYYFNVKNITSISID